MRDLHPRGLVADPNGAQARVDLTDEPEHAAPEVPGELGRVTRDRGLAEIAVMLLDTARVLEPIVSLASTKALRWLVVFASIGLTGYTLAHPSWERGAIVAGFMLLANLLVRGK